MNRRSLLKSGLALAGGSMLAANTNANSLIATKSISPFLDKRKLGTLEVSAIGLGVQNMPRTYQTTIPNRKEMINIIRKAYENGVTLFDTAEVYGPLESELILGEAVEPFRDKIVIETKFFRSRPEKLQEVVDAMLKRLRTDRIDLLYQHRVDPTIPIEDMVGAIKDLMSQGKVLHYGLSEPGLQTVRRAHATHPLTAIQNEYSLLWRGPENDVLPLCEELGIGFVPWSPLGVGFLTGAIDERTRFASGDIRGNEERFSPENMPNNLKLVNIIKKWAIQKNVTPAQLSLAWLLAQKPWIVPIPGTTQMAHMLENNGGGSIKFTSDELSQFNAEIAVIDIKGLRLPQGVLNMSGVEAPLKK